VGVGMVMAGNTLSFLRVRWVAGMVLLEAQHRDAMNESSPTLVLSLQSSPRRSHCWVLAEHSSG
jgi:hypothetical protein